MGPLGELGALFNPGMRHEIEERQSKANRREEEGNARDGDLRIDLASGVAVINMAKGGEQAGASNRDVDAPQQDSSDGMAKDVRRPDVDRPSAVDSSDGSRSDAADAPADTAGSLADTAGSLGDTAGSLADTAGSLADTAGSLADTDDPRSAAARSTGSLTAAQARRLATAARRAAGGDRPARPVAPRPANAQVPSSKASRAAR